ALPRVTTPPRIDPFQPLPLPGALAQTPLTYLAFLTVAVTAFVLTRTPLGLAVRAVGENPQAVEAQGLSVTALRLGAVAVGSGLMAVGGAFLTLSAFSSFFFEMVNGRGWICIALVVFGAWKPGRALLGALLFAAFDAWQIRLQQTLGAAVPYQVFLMLPYALSILALVVMSRRARVPAALMIPYTRGDR
ncbi:MAG TPA: ABC transporter permease, partial [Amaricoccus sp.]|nr:ABC transporter permease [Amaricoccus sp.]